MSHPEPGRNGPDIKVFDHSAKTSLTPEESEASLRLESACLGSSAVSADGHAYTFLDNQPYARMSSGWRIPIIGLGTW